MKRKIFTRDIVSELQPPKGVKIKLEGILLPNSQDYYFLSKWYEIYERYATARLFLEKAKGENMEYWFERVEDNELQSLLEDRIKIDLYETALINYNILVDLTWAWTYVSAEFAMYTFDDMDNVKIAKAICGMHTIDEAYTLLRTTENKTRTPNAEGNPFKYIKVMRPEFSDAIDTIVDFWKSFSESSIRNTYNFIKHKGRPTYKEINSVLGDKIMTIFIDQKEYPADIRDVQKEICLYEGISELVEFDNTILFPYVEKLLDLLKKAVKPSPMIYL